MKFRIWNHDVVRFKKYFINQLDQVFATPLWLLLRLTVRTLPTTHEWRQRGRFFTLE